MLTVHGVTYETESGQRVTVSEREMRAVMADLASANGFTVEQMLASETIREGDALQCLLVEKVPGSWWKQDSSGYILARFKNNCTHREVSFSGERGDRGKTFKPVKPAGGKRAAAKAFSGMVPLEGDMAAAPRASGRKRVQLSAFAQEDSSSDDEAGNTQPWLARFHRAAYAACMPCEELQDGWVLHICGNKLCAKVAHYYQGDEADNALDTLHHKEKPGTARVELPRVQ